ncbi:Sugar tr and/or MFS 1 domain containing protein [Asbolus verrucosus]|uniref:Sugar tr and/or MFS 1 domain containing protein n=1 Tax=Asbolus verrucosus TaxID=1661398 RepID=A0A482VJN2_ASBVE|nr:Sugar tr and/or MFS 1 domain containing protein [Asbolus verrucosus]
MDNSLDSILVQLGEVGKYQLFILGVVSLGATLHAAAHVAFVFTAMNLEYRCEIPECDTINPQFEPPWLSNAIPYSDNKPSKCTRFVMSNATDSCDKVSDFGTTVERCNSFVYKTERDSILKKYNLHCEDNLWKLALVGTINNAAQFFGIFIAGVLSDRFGRKVIFILGMTFCGICGVVRTFVPTYTWFLVFEFLDAAFGAGSHICGFIMGVELVGPKRRVLIGTLVNLTSSLGGLYAGGFAWIFQAWRPIIYSIYGPLILTMCFFWVIPESIRWNLSKGRLEEAKKTLKRVAEVNGKTISENSLEQLKSTDEESKNSFFEVFKSTTLVLRLINCCVCWITCAFLFYGLTLNSVSLAGNAYLDFMLTSLAEFPAVFACIYLADKIGRKWSLSGSFFLTGISCLAFTFIPKVAESHSGSLAVYMLGKFSATAAFMTTYVITSELFPTPLRHSMMGACSSFGRIGSMVAPQALLLTQIWEPLPLIVFTAMGAAAGFLALLFPEILNIKLPDTIEEAVSIGKDTRSVLKKH